MASVTASNSFGEIVPSVNLSPALTSMPSSTLSLAPYVVVCLRESASFMIVISHLPLASSILVILPVISAIVALPFGLRASKISSTRGRP